MHAEQWQTKLQGVDSGRQDIAGQDNEGLQTDSDGQYENVSRVTNAKVASFSEHTFIRNNQNYQSI